MATKSNARKSAKKGKTLRKTKKLEKTLSLKPADVGGKGLR